MVNEMRGKTLIQGAGFAIGFILLTLLPAEMVIADILPAPTKVSDHVYAWIGPHGGPNKENQGYRMNMAFVVGEKYIAVLETGYTEAMAREMLGHIRAISRLPVKYAINSNSQPDRFLGNTVFHKAGAILITHSLEKARMAKMSGVYTGAVERNLGLPENSISLPQLPDYMVSDIETLDLGNLKLVIRHLGASHTPAPLIVHVPQDRVIYAGDTLYSGRLLAVLPDSNVKEWIATYRKLRQYKNHTFIPGHGEPAGLEAFDISTLSYLTLLHTHMTRCIDEGLDALDAIKSLNQDAYSKLANFKQLAGRNASWAYLQAEEQSFNE